MELKEGIVSDKARMLWSEDVDNMSCNNRLQSTAELSNERKQSDYRKRVEIQRVDVMGSFAL